MFHTEERPNVDINAFLIDVTGEIDGFMYTYILLALLVATGIWFTIRTKAVQIRYIKDMFTQLTEKKHVGGKHSISSFQALMVSTASRVGTGNIAGVATAIATGGPGALFWLWVAALLAMVIKMTEVTLAVYYREKQPNGEYLGGPTYYMQKGLGDEKKLPFWKIFAVLFGGCIFMTWFIRIIQYLRQ